MWPETTMTGSDIATILQHATILQQPRKLKRWNVYFSQSRMRPEGFVAGPWDGLLQHRDTLESLVIETAYPEWIDWNLSEELLKDVHPCAPLGEFLALSELTINEECLHCGLPCDAPCSHENDSPWMIQEFPPKSETLKIMACDYVDQEELDFDSVLEQFVVEGKGCLKQIEITTRRSYKPLDFSQTESACLEKGCDLNSGYAAPVALRFRKSAIPRLLPPTLNTRSSQSRHNFEAVETSTSRFMRSDK
ncbi:uncharacterized protein BO95DRAFT_35075 [Aspergillus brunneoviolaceus CBS 621.78]|uniref:Uncharacterized protein n=1 Tax=Aspergillus brunneoviolaceus CBS 621.78 TaxID=1450534 RepID=A0ACD1FSE0_9EURO|nr:hypothetical protein BO95DRAFT_35075 [Aspergillus brunneoviolaceus CBS 621.78]RAH39908.1 hypothetical protein BO95DRAFT_35075 [Aspergillus brunneoviolaceus CBS 621.78]